MFWVKKDSQKQMQNIDFSKKGENTSFKTQNHFCNAYFYNRQPICSTLQPRITKGDYRLP